MACSCGRAPPSVTISVSAPRPSVPKTNEPSDGSSDASISVAAAPSPKIVRSERSVGSMYFEYVSAGDQQHAPGRAAADQAVGQRQPVDEARAAQIEIQGPDRGPQPQPLLHQAGGGGQRIVGRLRAEEQEVDRAGGRCCARGKSFSAAATPRSEAHSSPAGDVPHADPRLRVDQVHVPLGELGRQKLVVLSTSPAGGSRWGQSRHISSADSSGRSVMRQEKSHLPGKPGLQKQITHAKLQSQSHLRACRPPRAVCQSGPITPCRRNTVAIAIGTVLASTGVLPSTIAHTSLLNGSDLGTGRGRNYLTQDTFVGQIGGLLLPGRTKFGCHHVTSGFSIFSISPNPPATGQFTRLSSEARSGRLSNWGSATAAGVRMIEVAAQQPGRSDRGIPGLDLFEAGRREILRSRSRTAYQAAPRTRGSKSGLLPGEPVAALSASRTTWAADLLLISWPMPRLPRPPGRGSSCDGYWAPKSAR